MPDARDPIWPYFLRSTHHEDLTSHDSLDFVRDCLVECLDTHRSCHIWDSDPDDADNFSPLLRRVWVYQERLLSPRVIHPMNREISWECQVVSDCQCTHGEPRAPIHRDPKIRHAKALAPGRRDATRHKDAIAGRWRTMVYEYSGLELTKQTDRLPAIQGCAEQIYTQLKDSAHIETGFDGSYSFGLWEHCLVSDMTWESVGAAFQRSRQLFPVPTWSWASMDAKARYKSGHKRIHAQARLLRAPHDPRARHASTYIIMTALAIPARLKIEKRGGEGNSGSKFTLQVPIYLDSDYLERNSTSTSLHCAYNESLPDCGLRSANWDEEAWSDIIILRLAVVQSPASERETFCLVLWRYGKCVPGTGVHRDTKDEIPIYQRIGMFRTSIRVPYELGGHAAPAGARIDWRKAEKTTIAIE